MNEKLERILRSHSLSLFATIPLGDCEITRPYKLDKIGFPSSDKLFAVMLAVPYLTKQPRRNISAYAVPKDYHGYFKELFSSLIPELK